MVAFSLLWGAAFAALFHLWTLSRGPSFWITMIVVRGLPWLGFGLTLLLVRKAVAERYRLDSVSTGVALAFVSFCLLLTGSGLDWECPGTALAECPFALALIPWLGLTGYAFVVGLCSELLFSESVRGKLTGWLLTALFLVLNLSVSQLGEAKPFPKLEIALLQTGWTEAQKWDPRYVQVSKDRLVELTLAAKGCDLIIWPETAWPVRGMKKNGKDSTIIRNLARRVQGDLLVSSIEIQGDHWLNSVLQVTSAGRFAGEYIKQRLIPFGEYIPLPRAALGRFVKLKPRDPEDRVFVGGEGGVIFETQGYRYSVLVCYDSMVPGITARVARRIDFLVVVTNDAPLSWELPKELHFRSAILRAAQFRIPVFQAGNNGVTGVINSKGEVVKRVERGRTGPTILRYGP